MSPRVSINDERGYPCPKDGEILLLIDETARGGSKGAWCPKCHTVWLEADEIDLRDLDELPEVEP